MKIDKIKTANIILDTLSGIEGVVSVSMVGSFLDDLDSQDYSDIDTVVIVNELTTTLFKKCVEECYNLHNHPALMGRKLFVNSSFGPLKFDQHDNVVIHLMVYDIKGHIDHVIRSPFTCLDWERSEVYFGKKLADICSVGRLSIKDFKSSRRSINEYKNELKKGVLSYRYYADESGLCVEKTSHVNLDSRGKAEFIYHIIKNSLQNLNKLLTGDNVQLSEKAIWFVSDVIFVDTGAFVDNFFDIKKKKYKKQLEYDEFLNNFCMRFLEKFDEYLHSLEKDSHTIYFIRHAATEFNDCRFLGQKLDPDIFEDMLEHVPEIHVEKLYSSPLKRCLSSARKISASKSILIDDRLKEIDYGDAEGFNYEEFKSQFPAVVAEWRSGNDTRFPNGENQLEVAKRLKDFVNENYLTFDAAVISGQASAVITHNVVLRSLLGDYFNIPVHSWHKIKIPHMSPIEAIIKNGKLLLNCEREFLRLTS